MTSRPGLARAFRFSIPIVSAIGFAAVPVAAGDLDWGQCPVPGAEGDTLGADRWYVVASAFDDDSSGSSNCTLRDAIAVALTGVEANGCTVASAGLPGQSSPRAVILPASPYTYTLDDPPELVWSLDSVAAPVAALCGQGPEVSVVRAAVAAYSGLSRVMRATGPGVLSIYGVTIANGQAPPPSLTATLGFSMDGAGLLVDAGTVVDLHFCRLTGNFASGYGGGLACGGPDACYELDRVRVDGNNAVLGGGGIYGNGDIHSTVIADNAGGFGGGLYTEIVPPSFAPVSEGPGVFSQMTNTFIHGNNAQTGGGWYNAGYGETDGVTISANSAQTGGGLVVTGSHPEVLNNVTISGNRAQAPPGLNAVEGLIPVRGGGMFVDIDATVGLFNATISDNRHVDVPAFATGSLTAGGTQGAGLYVEPGATASYRQSFIAGNLYEGLTTDPDDCLVPPLTDVSAGYNRGGVGCPIDEIGDAAASAADLLPLADNGAVISELDPGFDRTLPGGGFLFTHALVASSDAIDAGPPGGCVGYSGGGFGLLLTDARGFLRVDGDGDDEVICDIGAFEFKASPAIWIDGFELKESPCNWSSVVNSTPICGKS